MVPDLQLKDEDELLPRILSRLWTAAMWRGSGAGAGWRLELEMGSLDSCAEPLVPLGYCGFCTMMSSCTTFWPIQPEVFLPLMNHGAPCCCSLQSFQFIYVAQCDLSAFVKLCLSSSLGFIHCYSLGFLLNTNPLHWFLWQICVDGLWLSRLLMGAALPSSVG